MMLREALLDILGLFLALVVQELLCKQVACTVIFPGSTFKYKVKH